jgi:dihydroxyacetone kinase-like protein
MWRLGEIFGGIMKKLVNEPLAYVDEMLEGMCAAHPEYYQRCGPENRVIVRPNAPVAGKVGLVSGGGSGHLPVFTGYVGDGLLDACAIGDVFSSPNVEQMMEAARRANGGEGVLLLYGNYSGDRMNFDMAAEMLEMEEIRTRSVLGTDDIASGGPDERDKRRGIAGLIYAYKAAGAKAEAGGSLDEVAEVAKKAVMRTRTVGIALTPCILPAAGKPTFEIGDDEMEIGMGIHGEPGVRRGPLGSADQISEEMMDMLLADIPLSSGERVSVLVNSLGATPLEELYIVYRYVAARLQELGVKVVEPLIGRYCTSMEMMGHSISIHLLDRELEALLKAPCDCPHWRKV